MFNESIALSSKSSVDAALPVATRTKMEHLFRVDLSAVRVQLTEALSSVGAAALAVGSDLFFVPDFYSPGCPIGDAMIAHEIAHVLQQRSRLTSAHSGPSPQILHIDCLEEEANLWACLALLDRSVYHIFNWRQAPCPSLYLPFSQTAAQPWIMMAKTGAYVTSGGDVNEKNEQRQGSLEKTLREYSKFFKKQTEGGKPVEHEFQQLTNRADACQKVRDAWKFLFEKDISDGALKTLDKWLGVHTTNGTDAILDRGRSDWDRDAMRNRIQFRVPGEMRYYFTYYELAWALYQEQDTKLNSTSSKSVTVETKLAKAIMDDSEKYVSKLLKQVASKVRKHLCSQNGEIKPEFLNKIPDKEPAYADLHGKKTYQDVLKKLQDASSAPELISLLHDVKDLFIHTKLINNQECDLKLQVSKEKNQILEINITKYDTRYNVGTADVASDWFLWMKEKNYPVLAGPSYTMMHMWSMADLVNATTLEKEALAYAMFGYWNVDWDESVQRTEPKQSTTTDIRTYPSSASPVHRFHETMAGAQSQLLPYDPEADANANYGAFIGRVREMGSDPIPPDWETARNPD